MGNIYKNDVGCAVTGQHAAASQLHSSWFILSD